MPPTIGATIHAALAAKKLRQADLASRLRTTRSTVHAIVHGDRQPRVDTLVKIARALDTSVDELLAGRWGKPRTRRA